MKGQISIVTINLNNESGLERTLKSITKNRDELTELVVVDGCSSDGSWEIIDNYSDTVDKRICEHDKGIYDAMNKGLSLSSGEWVIFINSGDELLGEICKFRKFLDRKYRIIYGVTVVNTDNGPLFNWGKKLNNSLDVIIDPPFFHQAIFYNRKYISNYPLEYSLIADRVMTYNILQKSTQPSWKFLNCEIASFRDGGISTNSSQKIIDEEVKYLKTNELLTPKISRQLAQKKLIYRVKSIVSKTPFYSTLRKIRWRLKSFL